MGTAGVVLLVIVLAPLLMWLGGIAIAAIRAMFNGDVKED
jgi:hypothetical protein